MLVLESIDDNFVLLLEPASDPFMLIIHVIVDNLHVPVETLFQQVHVADTGFDVVIDLIHLEWVKFEIIRLLVLKKMLRLKKMRHHGKQNPIESNCQTFLQLSYKTNDRTMELQNNHWQGRIVGTVLTTSSAVLMPVMIANFAFLTRAHADFTAPVRSSGHSKSPMRSDAISTYPFVLVRANRGWKTSSQFLIWSETVFGRKWAERK
mmetsp:Transcript_7111/g.15772  ORF Transcript_7111/g.15772 Transcript_7111/m.15772 type:complete len:207 (-) Transcript_7111:1093-1713(-)